MKKWYRFEKPGVAYGYAYFAGNVVELELSAEREREMMKDGTIVPASGAEIEAAQLLLQQESTEGPSLARMALVPPTATATADVQRQLDELFARVSTLEAQLAQMQKPGKKE